jgi:hypothetical protein
MSGPPDHASLVEGVFADIGANLLDERRGNIVDVVDGASVVRNGSENLVVGFGFKCRRASGYDIATTEVLHNSSASKMVTAT